MSEPQMATMGPWHRVWTRLPFFIWLVVLWMLLWGQLTVLAAITGIVMASFVMLVFRLPTVELSGRVNLWYCLSFVMQFAWQLLLGALTVAWQTVSPNRPMSAIVRVPLRVDDDLVMTNTAVVASLIPGSLVVDADREDRVLYLHAIGVNSRTAADKVRRRTLDWERRAVLAVGSRVQVALVRGETPPVAERRRAVLD